MQLKHIYTLLISTFVFVSCSETNTNNNEDSMEPTPDEWQLVWSDEFDGDV